MRFYVNTTANTYTGELPNGLAAFWKKFLTELYIGNWTSFMVTFNRSFSVGYKVLRTPP